MRTIWKFKLDLTDEQRITVPTGAQLLSAQLQFGELMLWALVDPRQTTATQRRIYVHGTGHPIAYSKPLRHLGTVQLNGGALIFHVFAEEL